MTDHATQDAGHLALQLMLSGAFHFDGQGSGYQEAMRNAFESVQSFEDFEALVGQMVEMVDCLLFELGEETPDDRMMFLFRQNEEMKVI